MNTIEVRKTPLELEWEAATEKQQEARRFVMNAMHYNGSLRNLVPASLWRLAYLMCDGFGEIDEAFAKQAEWDWSHVRDSSIAAITRAADVLAAAVIVSTSNSNKVLL